MENEQRIRRPNTVVMGASLASLATLLAAGPAQATVIISNAQYSAGGIYSANPISNTYGDANITGSASSGFVAGDPTISTSSSSLNTVGEVLGDYASLRYDFAVLGVTGQVHLLITAAVSATGYGYYNSQAEVDFLGPQTHILAKAFTCNGEQCPSNGTPHNATDGGSYSYLVSANTDYGIAMSVTGTGQYFSPYGPSSGISAWADPTVAFDPGYTIPTGAYIQFSSNLVDPSAVVAAPEPGSLALLVFGLIGLVGLKVRAAHTAG